MKPQHVYAESNCQIYNDLKNTKNVVTQQSLVDILCGRATRGDEDAMKRVVRWLSYGKRGVEFK